MGRGEKTLQAGVKGTLEAIAGRQGGKGIFGIEEAAEEVARRTKLAEMAERIAAYDRGYEGGRRRCPRCGQWQKYKGEIARELVFECGALTVQRASYVCLACGQTSYPLDEKLGLVEGKEQGRLREKLALLAVLTPYHQAPQVCQTLLGSERHAMTLRRVALREAERLAASGHHHTLPLRERDRLCLEVDGHLCPTREPKDGPEDQGDREAKAVVAFSEPEVAEVSKERHESLHKMLQARITDSETFRSIFAAVYRHAGGDRAAEVIVLADGARWIWSMCGGLAAAGRTDSRFQSCQAISVGCRQADLWGRLGVRRALGQGAGAFLLEDKVEQVLRHLERFLDLAPALATIIPYFQQNAGRRRYGTYRRRGDFIGSGAIESAGKQLSAARIKGPGMRWNITELNLLLTLRWVFLEQTWRAYWESQARLAA